MFNQDKLASQMTHFDPCIPVGSMADNALDIMTDTQGHLHCAWHKAKQPCKSRNRTHIVDVVWERDPGEKDRRWVRMEVRCEEGHGYFLLIRNHGGLTYFDSVLLDDSIVSPFAEGARW